MANMGSETGVTTPKPTTQSSNPGNPWAPFAQRWSVWRHNTFNNMSETLATLYKRNSNGKLQQWRIWAEGGAYYTEEGIVNAGYCRGS